MQYISEKFSLDLQKTLTCLLKLTQSFQDLLSQQYNEWLSQFIKQTLESMLKEGNQYLHDEYIEFVLNQEANMSSNSFLPNFDLNSIKVSHYYDLLLERNEWEDGAVERIILVLALLPHLASEVLLQVVKPESLLGPLGFLKTNNGQYLPTGHTVLQLLKINNLGDYQSLQNLFSPFHPFAKQGILAMETTPNQQITLSGYLQILPAALHLLTTGQNFQPQYSIDFPATLLKTDKTWDDLILSSGVQNQVDQAKQWVLYYEAVKSRLESSTMKGYRLMMLGPPGTGKTLTAMLLAKHVEKPLFRINIDRIVDKYVGETNKKLEKIFRQANNQGWILFFDEGDALFGKRSSGDGNSNERYANQEVNYLLTKMEEYEGMIFLSTNKGGSIDDAFKRRFDSRIIFREPDEYIRILLWEHFLNKGNLALSTDVSLREIAYHRDYKDFNAAKIEKFHRYCVLQAIVTGDDNITQAKLKKYLEDFGNN